MTKNKIRVSVKKSVILLITALITSLLLLAACKNPLVGLGPRVDLNPPEGTVTGIVNGDYVNGVISLTGTIEDDKEPEAVWASVEGSTVQGVLNSDGEWSIEINTEDATYGGDGEKDIVIYLRDASGKITEKQMLLFFDNTAPVVMVTSPELTSPQNTASFAIRGEAYDPMRLSSVAATVVQGTATVTANQGTNDSWAFTITHGASDVYGIAVTATDYAGNSSVQLYHSADLKALNGDVSITVIDLYQLSAAGIQPVSVSNGLLVSDFSDSSNDVGMDLPSGGRDLKLTYDGNPFIESNSGIAIDVDMSLDIPVIEIDNPNPATAAPGDTLGPTAKISGRVTDNVSIDPSSIEIRFLDSTGNPSLGSSLSDWTPVTSKTEINSRTFTFYHNLPAFGVDSDYAVEVRAKDQNSIPNEQITPPIWFHLDSYAPVIDIETPPPSSYIADGSGNIEGTVQDSDPIDVEISLDGGTTWRPVVSVAGSAVPQNWSYPISDWEANVGALGDFETINIKARATAAGSVTSDQYSITIDRNVPTITFITPGSGSDVNGVVTLRVSVNDQSLASVTYKIGISGTPTAVDEADIYSWSESIITTYFEDPNFATEISPGIWELPVEVTAVDKAGNITVSSGYTMVIDNARDRPNLSIIYPSEGESYGGEVTVSGIATDDDGTVGAVYVQLDLDTPPGGTPDFAGVHSFDDGINFDGMGAVTTIDESVAYEVYGLSSWSFALNTTGELYDVDGAGGHDGDIYARIWAEDPINPSVTSVPETRHFRLDDTLPRIDSILINGLSSSGNAYVSGDVAMVIDASDDSRINKLEISYDNGISWTNLGITPGPNVTIPVAIDTVSLVSGGNGILYLRIKATDDTGYTTLEVLPLNVDNNFPVGSYSGSEPILLSGTQALLQGTASDPVGSISGIDRIEVYLERDIAGPYDLYNPLITYNPLINPDPDILAEEITFGASNFYPDNPAGPGVMVVDDVNELGSDTISGDGDGFDESLTLVASTWNWWVKFNSENIPDGDLNVHYVVVDKAGNKVHGKVAARIENYPPAIGTVEVGSDLDFSGTVEGDETAEYTGPISVRQTLYFNIAASDPNQDDATLDVAIYRGSISPLNLVMSSDEGTIDISGYPEGLEDFIIVITDDSGTMATETVTVDINNSDTISPVITMATLVQGDLIDGHLEEAGDNPPYNHDGPDADVSGEITLRGTASDNHRIQEIRLSISDGSIANQLVASWSGGILVGQNGFVIESQSMTEEHGHEIEWSYVWNSQDINNVAENNIVLTFSAIDFYSPTNPAGTVQKQVDVVPYITDVTTFLSSAFASNPSVFNRASTGEYPVFDDDVIVVTGFNFGAGVSASIGGIPLTVSSPSLSSGTIDLGSGSPVSGELVLVVNGVISRNNTNDNSITTNTEPNGINNNLLTDDRLFHVWQSNLVPGTASARYPVMKIWDNGVSNKIGFSYADGEVLASVYDGGTIYNLENSYTRYNYTTFSYDDEGNYYSVALNSDRVTDISSSRAVFFSRNYNANSWHYTTGNNRRHFEHNYNGSYFNSLRTQYPDLVSVGDSDGSEHYLSYYDSSLGIVKFRYFTVGANTNTIGGAMGNWDTGNNWSALGEHTVAPLGEGGAYNAVAVVPTGAPGAGTALVAWYDSSGQDLVLAWNTNPAGSSDWSNRRVIDSFYAGQHVEMFVDGNGGVHLAYYSSASGSLKYAYLDSYSDTSPEVYTVDSYLSVGTNVDIIAIFDGTDYIPYISYSLSAYKDTSMSLRMAYQATGARGHGVNFDQFTGDWVVSTIPVSSVPKDYKVSIGELDGKPVVGFVSNLGLQWVSKLE